MIAVLHAVAYGGVIWISVSFFTTHLVAAIHSITWTSRLLSATKPHRLQTEDVADCKTYKPR